MGNARLGELRPEMTDHRISNYLTSWGEAVKSHLPPYLCRMRRVTSISVRLSVIGIRIDPGMDTRVRACGWSFDR